ncbi:hypothetical protein [Frankia sp. CiP1_Cm_nod1]
MIVVLSHLECAEHSHPHPSTLARADERQPSRLIRSSDPPA